MTARLRRADENHPTGAIYSPTCATLASSGERAVPRQGARSRTASLWLGFRERKSEGCATCRVGSKPGNADPNFALRKGVRRGRRSRRSGRARCSRRPALQRSTSADAWRASAAAARAADVSSAKMPKQVGPLPDMAAMRQPGWAASAALMSATAGRSAVAGRSRSLLAARDSQRHAAQRSGGRGVRASGLSSAPEEAHDSLR